jgi:hypothetical protein
MSDTPETEDMTMPPGATRLPSGGWAVLKPRNELTGLDVRRIRKTMNAEGTGDMVSGAMAATLGAIIVDWQIPGRDRLKLPYHDPRALDAVPFDDLMTLEDVARPIMRRALGEDKKEDGPDPS